MDTRRIRAVQNSIGQMISSTSSLPKGARVSLGFGHYAGLIKVGNQQLALHTDGVGTKVMIAQMMERYDTVGIDCVAMNVNDIICVGARPLAFVDYIALKEPNESLVAQLVAGLVKGAEISEMAIVGGETAILPDLISGAGEKAFDLAGTVLGMINGQPVLGKSIRPGDVIVGVESSGLHSNGYSLARKILLSKYSLDDTPEHVLQTLGDELLTPTKIYVKPILELLRSKIAVRGLANITGGAFSKLVRLNKSVDYVLDEMPQTSGIFKQIQTDGRVELAEMYRTFNMGIGFCVIVQRKDVEKVVRTFNKYKMPSQPIGRITKGVGRVFVVVGEGKLAL